jgi:hypothetical protein
LGEKVLKHLNARRAGRANHSDPGAFYHLVTKVVISMARQRDLAEELSSLTGSDLQAEVGESLIKLRSIDRPSLVKLIISSIRRRGTHYQNVLEKVHSEKGAFGERHQETFQLARPGFTK